MPTIGFSNKRNAWTSRYSYASSCFSRVNNKFFSSPSSPTTNGTNDGPIWRHESGTTYNKFYGTVTPSSFNVTFSENPSTNKIFKTLSFEGTKNLADSYCFFRTSNHLDESVTDQGDMTVGVLRNVNGTTYGPIPREKSIIGGKTMLILGKLERGQTGVAVASIPGGTYGPHGQFFKAFLDPSTGISPQIQTAKETPMLLAALLVTSTSSTLLFDNTDLAASLIDGYTYSTMAPLSQALVVKPDATPGVTPYDPSDFTINFTGGVTLAGKINSSVGLPDADVYLVGIAHPSLAGDTARGQYAEARVQIPASKGYFEVYAMNLQYEPIQLAHDK